MTHGSQCEISGFHHKGDVNCALLGCYAVHSGNSYRCFRPTYRSNLQGSAWCVIAQKSTVLMDHNFRTINLHDLTCPHLCKVGDVYHRKFLLELRKKYRNIFYVKSLSFQPFCWRTHLLMHVFLHYFPDDNWHHLCPPLPDQASNLLRSSHYKLYLLKECSYPAGGEISHDATSEACAECDEQQHFPYSCYSHWLQADVCWERTAPSNCGICKYNHTI